MNTSVMFFVGLFSVMVMKPQGVNAKICFIFFMQNMNFNFLVVFGVK